MTAEIQQIKGWLARAQKKGARYMIVTHDGFDMGDFPIYVMPQENFWEKCPPRRSDTPFATIHSTAHEVYDLEISIDYQLSEVVAWHPPVR